MSIHLIDRRHRRLFGVHIVLSLLNLSLGTPASDMIYAGGNLTDGNTLVSAGGSFTLGFFSPPGEPTKRYLGTWFSFSPSPDAMSIYWVANRDTPLGDTSGVLMLTNSGILVLLDGSNNSTVWSSDSTSSTPPMGARLLESGNLVIVQGQNNNTAQWQSFDHPCNSLLPEMKIGQNLWKGDKWYLSSWRSAADPGTGIYRYITELGGGTPENVMSDSNGTKKYRTGPWNGERFDGVPEMASYASDFKYHMTISRSEVTYSYTANPGALYSQLRLDDSGVVQRLVWDNSSRLWNSFLKEPRDDCDDYAHCGPFGLCDRNAASTSLCSCFKGFVPAFPKEWSLREYSGGCRRNVSLDCSRSNQSRSSTDGFQVVALVKLPDTQNATVDMDTSLDECRFRCLANCSCVAYAAADGGSSGCIIWTDSFTDLRFIEKGQDFYLRLPKSLLLGGKNKKVPMKVVVLVVVAGALVLAGIVIFRIWWRPTALVGHWIDYQILKDGTDNFSEKNMIGQGSFGKVYQCELPRRESTRIGLPVGVNKVAVKVLNQSVLNKFERELQVLFRLSHVNLVRLLAYSYSKPDIGYCCNLVGLFACCKKGPLLIYEYMERRSLNLYIFGKDDRQLSMTQRLQTITSIANGVFYLHVHSGRDVIHRDLKPANILLADDLTPKIADFGLAKHAPDPTAQHTPVGAYGYLAPECRNGQTTKKSDVYSFGVVMLEIISGRQNCLELARLHPEDLLDRKRVPLSQEEDGDPNLLPRIHRYIQIGLLCVQESPDRRPDISQVVEMLKTEVKLREPEEPGLGEEGKTSNTRTEEPTLKEEGETSDTRCTEEPTLREEGETSNKRPIEEPVVREEGETSQTRPTDDDIEQNQEIELVTIS